MKPPIIDTIQKKGFWKVTFTPSTYKERLPEPPNCLEIVDRNKLQVTGWDYPHIARRNDETNGDGPGNNYYQSWTSFEEYNELWRFYQSGKFLHYRCVWEDWSEVKRITGLWISHEEGELPKTWLGVTRTTYFITQVVEFLARLVKENIYDTGVEISIELHNTNERCLVVDHPNRVPLMGKYQTQDEVLKYSKEFTSEYIEKNKRDIAFQIVRHFFVRFGWQNQPEAVIRQDIENILSGRLV